MLPTSSTLKMEAACSFEILVNSYWIKWCHIPEDGSLILQLFPFLTFLGFHILGMETVEAWQVSLFMFAVK
jgi:hypothetical protein